MNVDTLLSIGILALAIGQAATLYILWRITHP